MNLSEHFRQATEAPGSDGLDLHRLARVARSEGTRARRRQRGVALLGSAALVGVVAGGSALLLGPDPDRAAALPVPGVTPSATATDAPTASPTDVASATPTSEPTLDPADTGPFTGRGIAAALRFAVSDVEAGRAGAFAGQATDEAFGQLDWTDADGLGVSVVGVNVQPQMDFVTSCTEAYVHHCTSSHRDGGTLTTYDELTPVRDGVGVRRVADFLRADGTRVVASATNGYDLPSNQWDVTRTQPPLGFAELARVVSQPWWGAELPTYFLEQGRALAPYDDLGSATAEATAAATAQATAEATPSSSPTPSSN
jgi:hypothetical protein